MNRILILLCLILLLAVPVHASHRKQVERLENATVVLTEILKIPENIPRDLLKKAECVAIIPSMKKAAIGVGGEYGRGCMVCRVKESWSPPVMISMTGGSFGFQLGGSSTDIVLLVMNKKGINKLLESKVTLGADATVAGGPKGRTAAAATDIQMRAEMLCYSRSRGLFAGVALDGSVLKPESDDDEDLYGKPVNAKTLLLEGGAIPEPAKKLIQLLSQF